MPTRDTPNAGLRAAVARRGDSTVQRDDSLHGWLKSMQTELARALPAGGLTADRLARIVLTEVRRIPRLAQCTRESFAGALMTCAQLGLEPGSATGEAYLLPFKNGRTGKYEVSFVMGYQGMARLYWQSPLARSLDAQVVYQHDEFDYAYGLEPKLVHKPALGERGAPIAYYAVATLTSGGSAFVVLSPGDVERIKQRSKAKDDGPWQTDYDAMARKTAVRQLFKLLPKSPQLARAMGQDEQIRTDTAISGIDVSGEQDFPAERIVDGQTVDTDTGEITDPPGEDGDQADPDQAAAPAPEPPHAPPPATPSPEPAEADDETNLASREQLNAIHAAFRAVGITDRTERLTITRHVIGRQIASAKDLWRAEAGAVLDELAERRRRLDTADEDAALEAAYEADQTGSDDEPGTDD